MVTVSLFPVSLHSIFLPRLSLKTFKFVNCDTYGFLTPFSFLFLCNKITRISQIRLDASERLLACWPTVTCQMVGWLRGFALGLMCDSDCFLSFRHVTLHGIFLSQLGLKTLKFVSSIRMMSWFFFYNSFSGYCTHARVKIGGKTLSCRGHSGFHTIRWSL